MITDNPDTNSRPSESHTPGHVPNCICVQCESPSSRPMTLRQQLSRLIAQYNDGELIDMPMGTSELIDRIEALCQEIAREAEYNKGVVEGLKLVSDAEISGTWVNPVTGAKMYNQGYLDEAAREARLDELIDLWNETDDETSEAMRNLDARIVGLTQKPPQPPQGGLEEVSDEA